MLPDFRYAEEVPWLNNGQRCIRDNLFEISNDVWVRTKVGFDNPAVVKDVIWFYDVVCRQVILQPNRSDYWNAIAPNTTVIPPPHFVSPGDDWTLRGVASSTRYPILRVDFKAVCVTSSFWSIYYRGVTAGELPVVVAQGEPRLVGRDQSRSA
jgi:hypothetical protein